MKEFYLDGVQAQIYDLMDSATLEHYKIFPDCPQYTLDVL